MNTANKLAKVIDCLQSDWIKQRRSQSKLTDFFKTVLLVACVKLQYRERLFGTFHKRPYSLKEVKEVIVFFALHVLGFV